MGIFSLITGRPGPSGFGSASTAEQVTEGVDASNLTAIVTGQLCLPFPWALFSSHKVHDLLDWFHGLLACSDSARLLKKKLIGDGMAMCHIAKYFKKVMCMVAHDSCGFGLEDDGDGDEANVVVGGASGIGFETARVLALRKAHVVIAARNMDAANEAKQLILKDNEAAHVDVLKLDLCSMKSIRAFVDNFNALNLPLNLLINNAGIMFCPFQLSQDGIESQFATNHIGHFLLTNLLLDKMKSTARTTACFSTSSFSEISYSDKRAYGQSKLANILHAKELSRRLQEEGANITVNAVHPGLIMTNLFRHSAVLMKILQLLSYILWKNVPQGAATTCYVALHPSMKGVSGKYYLDCNEMAPSAYASDETLAKKLWDFSNKLVNSPPTTSN
ncbi:Short-chain dehydrogenase TIC 32, chloroplastic [Vitis vinifera]|uniref:Short-chain dehydrogenase TIC 32, chloroplastic n=1 Tax=Vitis vinifera TaxID=29760 RepID=A0A438IPR9_VITVI|nr:Short-chain dehydrogenase TIC 32, chloroplastic [Vitis vinifera]